jgi:peptide/nickel transport system permease protein
VSESAVAAAELAILPRRRQRVSLTIALSFAFVGFIALCAIFGDWIAPKDPYAQDLLTGLTTPSSEHWLGTDDLGRDVFSRSIVGARTAVVGPILIALGATLIGNTLGLIAGYKGGWIDSLILRWVDLMYALPGLLVAIVVVGILGGGYFLAVALLIFLAAPYVTRIARGATLEQRPLPYVEAARTLGLSSSHIMARHIWPNVLPFALATACLNFAFALVTLSGLSFLGLGVDPATADWGRMLAESRTLIFDNPVAALAPGMLIVLTAASVNLIGDWFYEWLSDRGSQR